jgi:hypothetical protein
MSSNYYIIGLQAFCKVRGRFHGKKWSMWKSSKTIFTGIVVSLIFFLLIYLSHGAMHAGSWCQHYQSKGVYKDIYRVYKKKRNLGIS